MYLPVERQPDPFIDLKKLVPHSNQTDQQIPIIVVLFPRLRRIIFGIGTGRYLSRTTRD